MSGIPQSGFRQRLWQRLQEAGFPELPANCLVNGVPGRLSMWVGPADLVSVAGTPLPAIPARCYYAYHKPVGIDCNVRPGAADSISQLLQQLPAGVFPVGRLDKDSCGLLLLTNDGPLAAKLLHPDGVHQKTYRVTLDHAPTATDLQALAGGMLYRAGPATVQARPCGVWQSGDTELMLTLTEGKNRQIRYMLKTLGYRVLLLQRVAIGQLTLANLLPGQYQALSPADVLLLTSEPAQPKAEQ